VVTGADVVAAARQDLGYPYVWGAHGPKAFDCSGLVEAVYRKLGYKVPGTTSAMMAPGSNLITIDRKQLAPGDLVFSNWIGRKSSHVGIYAGNNQIIEAPEPGKTVTATSMGPTYWAHTDAFRRVPGIGGATTPGGAIDVGAAALNAAGLGGLAGWIPNPSSITDALTNIGNVGVSVAQSAGNVGQLAGLITRAFLPSYIIRGMAFMTGMMFLIVGIWFLAREVRDS